MVISHMGADTWHLECWMSGGRLLLIDAELGGKWNGVMALIDIAGQALRNYVR